MHTQAAVRHPKKSGLGVGGSGRYFGNALNFRLMKSARFLVVALLLSVWSISGCASLHARQQDIPQLQKKPSFVAGYAIDALNQQPMAGIPIEKNGGQTVTAKDGYFRLKYRADKRVKYRWKYLGEADVLRVSSLNYAGSVTIPVDTAQRVRLLLTRNTYRFPPHGLLHAADSIHVSNCGSPWLGFPGSQRAYLIQDSSCRELHKLRAITVCVGKDGFAREPFRVRIYQYNGPEQPPGKDLLTENFIISTATEGSFTYDLAPYDINVSGKGFFLAFEYVVGGDSFYTAEPIVGYYPIGPVLHPPYKFDDIRTWVYTIGKGWQRSTAAENCWPLYESALSVEVEPAPTKR
jgi:hypothetical protein